MNTQDLTWTLSSSFSLRGLSWQASPATFDEFDDSDAFGQNPLTSDNSLPVDIPGPSHNTHHITHSQDVRPVLNTPSPAPRSNGFPTVPLESSLSSSSRAPHGPINTNSSRLRTAPVFASTHDLAAHYGIPQSLPPPPRPSLKQQPAPTQSSASLYNFDSICKNYLTMLSQKPTDPEPTGADTAKVVPSADPMQAIHDLLASPEFQNLGDSFDATSPLFDDAPSPLFNDSPSSFDVDSYLTSPFETPYDDFATSPADDSPFSDFLTTPVLPSADSDMLTEPLIEDVGYSDNMSLFGGLSAYPTYEVTELPKTTTPAELYTISPTTPALDAVDPATTFFPKKRKSASGAPSPAEVPPPTRRRAMATGTRKNLKPSSLIPLEAPTQKRTYASPSVTSRKAVPAVFAKKRGYSVAFEEDELAELGELSPTATEQETIEYKRRQNTLAARKSRKRKLEHQQQLEGDLARSNHKQDTWRNHALKLQDLLRVNGIAFVAMEDDSEE
ncbi:hypothetical protein FB45DRAFT_910258 [Roridomyces roridus]|uniref:BZIP domain-containing protein n=1 Tax=Roridomyces roridus TaxID=1738132 RepID=A0AAD7BZK0_9AGAR|nr:hypothetical protein FB45DRAFT_910258 [Roridomyces roridus]